MLEGNISAALKLLDCANSKGLLKLSDAVMDELLEKHPEPIEIKEGALLHGPLNQLPECYFDDIDEETIMKAAKDTKGSAGPSGMDANQFRRVLCSKNFNKVGKSLREEIALFSRNLATKQYDPEIIDAA